MTMTRRVLHLIDTAVLSGPGKTIVNSCRFSRGSEYEKLIAAFSHTGKNEFVEYAKQQGVRGFEIRERFWWLPGPLSSVAVIWLLRSLLRRERVGLLHSHGFKADVLGRISVIGMNIRMVTTQHGFINNTNHARLYNWLAVQASKRMDKVIAVSNKMRETLRNFGVSDEKLAVIHNAIVVEDYLPRVKSESVLERHGLEGCTPILGCVGRLSQEKGQSVLCAAVVSLLERLPSLCLLLIGSGPQQEGLQEKYKQYAKQIIFVGQVKDVREYFSVMDLHILPSFTEGLPNVVLEASCMGIPTVATAVGGTPECLVDGETGILVPSGDSVRLAEAIWQVVHKEERRVKFGLEAAKFVRERFGFEDRATRMIALYEEVFRCN